MNRSTILIFIGIMFCVIDVFAQRKRHELIKPYVLEGTSKIMNQPEPTLPTDSVIKRIGKEVYIYDQISGVKQISDSLKIWYAGGIYPNNRVCILIKGNELIKELYSFHTGSYSYFTGKVFIYEGKPAIEVTSSIQLGQQIQL